MACYHPLRGYLCTDGSVVFVERSRRETVRTLELSCGQCVGCRLERSRQWAVRCVHEASLYERNCFITLTYRPESLRADGSLCYRDFQLFMKRLRKRFPGDRIRFFMCGEYGEGKGRPHFHACLFNFDFVDKVLFSSSKGIPLFTSAVLAKLWPDGYSTVGAVTYESAAYVARYLMAKVTGDQAEYYYTSLDEVTGELVPQVPEFCHMSLKPGIGAGWYEKFVSDVFPCGRLVFGGVETTPPVYYTRKFKKSHGDSDAYAELVRSREVFAKSRAVDSTDERLGVREQVERARVSLLKRSVV